MRRGTLLILLLAGCCYGVLLRRMPHGNTQTGAASFAAREVAREKATGGATTDAAPAWFVLRGGAQEQPSPLPRSALDERYRLAGTFFSSGQSNGRNRRTAIIDQVQSGEQRLLEEGDLLDEFQIVCIERDRAILRKDEEESVLQIGFQDQDPLTSGMEPTANPTLTDAWMDNLYAKQVGESRWVLNRAALMDYYTEMLDDPERIASIYISLKPDYGENQKIAGYELDMVGEEAFFKNMGLVQGDRIRKVNSMNMTSQSRGEYFLKEFVNSRLSAIVLDIERDNVPKKMIYLVR